MLLLSSSTSTGGEGGALGTAANRIAANEFESTYPSRLKARTENLTNSPSYPDGRLVTTSERRVGIPRTSASESELTSIEGVP